MEREEKIDKKEIIQYRQRDEGNRKRGDNWQEWKERGKRREVEIKDILQSKEREREREREINKTKREEIGRNGERVGREKKSRLNRDYRVSEDR